MPDKSNKPFPKFRLRFEVRDACFDEIEPEELQGFLQVLKDRSGYFIFRPIGSWFQLQIPMADVAGHYTYSEKNGVVHLTMDKEAELEITPAMKSTVKKTMKDVGTDRFELITAGTSEILTSVSDSSKEISMVILSI